MASPSRRFAAPLLALSLAACGGTAVVEQGSGGAGSGATSTSAASTGTGAGPCTTHEQCPGGVCVFLTGQCAPACDLGFCEGCGPGLLCDGCGTSSCPDCLDCVGACLPVVQGRCDDDDPCPPGEQCLFTGYGGYCNPSCGPDGSCPAGYLCDGCGTSSCCGCKNCVEICIGQ